MKFKTGLLMMLLGVLVLSTVAFASDKIVIGYAARNVENPYWVAAVNGIKDAAAKYGVEVVIYNAAGDPAKQRNDVQDFVQAKVDAILITSIVTGSATSGAAADVAVKAGIPVIGVDTSAGSPRVAVTIRTDNVLGGKLAGEYIGKLLNGAGNVVVLEGPAGDTNSALRVGGFMDALTQYPDIKVIASQPADWNREKGFNVMSDLLQAFPKIDAVFAANDEMALGATGALKTANRLANTAVVGFDATPDGVASVNNGEMSATVQQHPYEEGYQAVELALKILNGEAFSSKVVMRDWPWGIEHAIEIPATLITPNK